MSEFPPLTGAVTNEASARLLGDDEVEQLEAERQAKTDHGLGSLGDLGSLGEAEAAMTKAGGFRSVLKRKKSKHQEDSP